MNEGARILLADDHALVRRGVRLILDSEPGLHVVAEAEDGAEAVAACRTRDIDLAILDVAMPTMTGLQAAREISGRRERPRILMLSMYDHEQYFFEALKAGACGYVLKSAADQDLIQACHAAMRGASFVYPAVTKALLRNYLERERRGEPVPQTVLTAREDQVLKLIAEGHTSREIAQALTISIKTVDRHRANILEKLGMRDRTELTRYAIRAGLVEP
jgi:DNA-binding NarL/FixJ family response regulator